MLSDALGSFGRQCSQVLLGVSANLADAVFQSFGDEELDDVWATECTVELSM